VWCDELRADLTVGELADGVDGAEEQLEKFSEQREATVHAFSNTIGEGVRLREDLW